MHEIEAIPNRHRHAPADEVIGDRARHRERPVLLLDLADAPGDLAQRGVPRDLLPLALAPYAFAPQRINRPLRMLARSDIKTTGSSRRATPINADKIKIPNPAWIR